LSCWHRGHFMPEGPPRGSWISILRGIRGLIAGGSGKGNVRGSPAGSTGLI
jgi:hypothetical protein